MWLQLHRLLFNRCPPQAQFFISSNSPLLRCRTHHCPFSSFGHCHLCTKGTNQHFSSGAFILRLTTTTTQFYFLQSESTSEASSRRNLFTGYVFPSILLVHAHKNCLRTSLQRPHSSDGAPSIHQYFPFKHSHAHYQPTNPTDWSPAQGL